MTDDPRRNLKEPATVRLEAIPAPPNPGADPLDPGFGGVARLHKAFLHERAQAHRQLLQVHTAALALLIERAQARLDADVQTPAPPAPPAPAPPAPAPRTSTAPLPAPLLLPASPPPEPPAPPPTLKPGERLTVRRPPVAGQLTLGALVEAATRPCLELARRAPLLGRCAHYLEGNLTLHQPLGEESAGLRVDLILRSAVERGGEQKLDLDVEVYGAAHLATLESVLSLLPPEQLDLRAQQAPLRSAAPALEPPLPLGQLPRADLLPAASHPLLGAVLDSRPKGGRAGLGLLRVQLDEAALAAAAEPLPGDLLAPAVALEAAAQALRLACLLHAADALPADAVQLLPTTPACDLAWSSRAAIPLRRGPICCDLELTRLEVGPQGLLAAAEAWILLDDRALLHIQRLAVHLTPARSAETPEAPRELLDLHAAPWLADYCPTFTDPALPLLFVADRLIHAALVDRPGEVVYKLERLVMARWWVLREPVELRTTVELTRGRRAALTSTLLARPAARRGPWEEVASARLVLAPSFGPCRDELPPLHDAAPLDDPYATSGTFHGPAFQLLRQPRFDAHGAAGLIDLDALPRGGMPPGVIHPAALEAGLHLATPQALTRWSSDIHPRLAVYPIKLERATFHAPPPTQGSSEVQLRFDGFVTGPRFPSFTLYYLHNGEIWATLLLVCVLVPQSRLQRLEPALRAAFTRERRFVPGVGLSRFEPESTRIRLTDLQAADWIEDTVAGLYKAPGDPEAQARLVGVKDHFAQRLLLHPAEVCVDLHTQLASAPSLPFKQLPFRIQRDFMAFVVTDAGPPLLDLDALKRLLRRFLLADNTLAADLLRALFGHVLGAARLPDSPLPTTPALYLLSGASPLALTLLHALVPALTGVNLAMLPDRAALPTWLERLHRLMATCPDGAYPHLLAPEDGARTLAPPAPLEQSALLVMRSPSHALQTARQLQLPVVRVAVTQAPTDDDLADWLRPIDLSFLDPCAPEHLTPDALLLTPPRPLGTRPDPRDLLAEARAWSAARRVELPFAVIFKLLQYIEAPSLQTRRLTEAAAQGEAHLPNDPTGRWLAAWAPLFLGEAMPLRFG